MEEEGGSLIERQTKSADQAGSPKAKGRGRGKAISKAKKGEEAAASDKQPGVNEDAGLGYAALAAKKKVLKRPACIHRTAAAAKNRSPLAKVTHPPASHLLHSGRLNA